MNQAVIGLGSNINPESNIAKSKKLLAENFIVLKESDFIQTKPIGYTQQPDFTNGAILVKTNVSLPELKRTLQTIEKKVGRRKSAIKFGPRVIDLDVIMWNDTIIDKDFYTRDFLKNSVLQLIPDLKY